MRKPIMFIGLALAALLALGAEYNPLRGNRLELAARGTSTTAKIASRTSGAVTIDNDLVTSGAMRSGGVITSVGNLTIGTVGVSSNSIIIASQQAGKSLQFGCYTDGTTFLQANGGGALWANSSSSIRFNSDQLFQFNQNTGGTARATINALTGDFNLITGSLLTNGTARLDVSGNATLATATTGGAKDWGKLAAAPSSPGEADTYYDTALHKRRTWDGSAWQNHW